MKTKLGMKRKLRLIVAYIDLIIFSFKKFFLGFDYANNSIKRMGKNSIQLILKRYGATIGNNCDIETGLTFHNCENYKNLIIGENCHIGKNSFFDLRDRIIIKNNVVISMQSTFITHIEMTKSDLSSTFPKEQKFIKINNGCYLGVRSIILMGVELGEYCVVAAGSVVTKNVLPFTMVGGVPAREIKRLNKLDRKL